MLCNVQKLTFRIYDFFFDLFAHDWPNIFSNKLLGFHPMDL